MEKSGKTTSYNAGGGYLQLYEYPLLTAKQEVQLAEEIKAGRLAQETLDSDDYVPDITTTRENLQNLIAKGTAAREYFIMANLRLVRKIANKYEVRQTAAMDLEDLVIEGIFGLNKAIDRFDPTRGYKFSVYAIHWIEQSITYAIDARANNFKIRNNLACEIRNLLTEGVSEEPSGNAETQPKTKRLLAIGRMMNVLSLDEPLQLGNGETGNNLQDLIPDPVSIEDAALSEVIKEQISRIISQTLTPREAKIIEMHYGLGMDRPYTFREIGEEFAVSCQAIEKTCNRILHKLADPRNGLSKDMLEIFAASSSL